MTFNFDALPSTPPSSGRQGASAAVHDAGEDPHPRRRAVLVGQPNVGKSVVFGALTGSYVTVSNYPGTTVEVTRGRARFGEHAWEVVDTPGTHNLVPMSEDEAVTRDILVAERHDALVRRWATPGEPSRARCSSRCRSPSSVCRSTSISTCSTKRARGG